MKALVTGANGQLGKALRQLLPEATFTDYQELDITDAGAVASFDWHGIQAIINAAAFTNVDGAEASGQLLASWNINVTGVANLAAQARSLAIPLVHVSTDYVFEGNATQPIPVDAPLDPKGMYGIEKAASEFAARIAPTHYVVRTSWVFGDGPNFVRTMLKLAGDRDELAVVNDQLGRPTYAPDLAAALIGLLERGAPGTYHFSNNGDIVSWAEFAKTIFEVSGSSCKVTPISTAQYLEGKTGIAPRPAYSALDLSKTEIAGVSARDWRAALKDYLTKENAS
jgi:dTDP-4-dehydrorhamnose reductase